MWTWGESLPAGKGDLELAAILECDGGGGSVAGWLDFCDGALFAGLERHNQREQKLRPCAGLRVQQRCGRCSFRIFVAADVPPRDGFAVQAGDEVARVDAGGCRGRTRHDAGHAPVGGGLGEAQPGAAAGLRRTQLICILKSNDFSDFCHHCEFIV